MRRIAACLAAALVLTLGAPTGADPAAAAVAQDDGGSPDIIPEPDPDGEGRDTNWGGLIVGVAMLTAWVIGGAVLLVRARRRREQPPTD